jgi:bidirectional [NiFe] hydrogenase diaphorase subunit
MEAKVAEPSKPKADASKPAEDRRWRMVDRTMRLHGYQTHALIETLHSVQEAYGYLDMDVMQQVAKALKVPLSQVFGVATFYHFFSLKPAGEHTCVICTGTACYIGGASSIVEGIHKEFGVEPGETTEDGKVSVVIARCIGSCGLAPAIVYDGAVSGKETASNVLDKLRKWRNS